MLTRALRPYRFAKAAKSSKEEWLKFTKDYFINRENLVSVLLLVDSSVPPQDVDKDCANWLAECEVPFCIVFTKIDNQKKGMPPNAQNVRGFKQLVGGLATRLHSLLGLRTLTFMYLPPRPPRSHNKPTVSSTITIYGCPRRWRRSGRRCLAASKPAPALAPEDQSCLGIWRHCASCICITRSSSADQRELPTLHSIKYLI